MDDARGREPRGDEHGADLCQPDGGGGLENVEVLQNVREGHEAEGAQEAEACNDLLCPLDMTVMHVALVRQTLNYGCFWL